MNTIEDTGYIIVRNAITPDICKFIEIQCKLLEQSLCYKKDSDFNFSDSQCKYSFSYYSAIFTESLMLYLQPMIEKYIIKTLYPTYSYFRIYYNGSILENHTDRESCEYSATICIKNDKNPWDIYFKKNKTISRIAMNIGDLIIYKGIEVEHWRNIYNEYEQIQVFIHFVDKNGKYSEYKYDKRKMLYSK